MADNTNKVKKSIFTTNVNQPSRTEFEQLAEASNDAIRIINNDFTIRYINRAFAEMTGVDQNSVIGKKCWEVFPSSLCHTTDCRAQLVLNGEEKIEIEIERQKYTGTFIPCIVTASPLKDDDGNLASIIEQFRDITEKRRIEYQAKETEEQYRALIDLSNEAGEAIVMLQDIDGREGIQTFVSDQWPKITGYPREYLLGTSFFNLLNPKDREASIARHRLKMSGQDVPGLYELDIIRKDGTKTDIEITGAATIYQGKPANVVYIRDISERIKMIDKQQKAQEQIRRSEEKLKDVLGALPVATFELNLSSAKKSIDLIRSKGIINLEEYIRNDPYLILKYFDNARVICANQLFLELFKVRNQEELWVKIKSQIKTDIEMGLIEKHISRFGMLAGGATHFFDERPFFTADDETKYMRSDFRISRGSEDDWSSVYTTLTDITQYKNSEENIEVFMNQLRNFLDKNPDETTILNLDLRKELQQKIINENELINEQVGLKYTLSRRVQFMRALVHELKSYITPLIAAVELLDEQYERDCYPELRNTIKSTTEGLNNRIDEILDLAKGEMGLLSLKRKWVHMNEVLEEIGSSTRIEAVRRRRIFKLDLENNLPTMWVDEDRIIQMLLNLIHNAIRYTPESGEFGLSAWVKEDELHIEVKDTGPGLTQYQIDNIFIPYHSFHEGEQQPYGLGVGLVLSKMFAELHGGSIKVCSEINKMSVFTIILPVKA